MIQRFFWIFFTFALMVGVASRLFFVDVIRVGAHHMSPTLVKGDIVVFLKKRWVDDFSQGDVVSFYSESGVHVGRLLARTGDKVEVRAGRLFVNEELRFLPDEKQEYAGEKRWDVVIDPAWTQPAWILGPTQYLVLPDWRIERAKSQEVSGETIIGAARLIVFSFDVDAGRVRFERFFKILK